MHNFGFKVVDRHPAALAPILDYALAHGRPVEVGLYYGAPEALALLARRLAPGAVPVAAHTDHQRCNAFNLKQSLDALEAHVRQARALGSAYSVLHAAPFPLPSRPCLRPELMTLLLDNLERAEALCAAHEYRFHLENVFHPLSFYRELFSGVQARGLTRIHFCFDLGHAKVWSGESLDAWLRFLDELEAAGVALHCHLHANGGFADEHLSLAEARDRGIAGADGYYNPYGYPEAYWQIERRFPRAIKVFEVKAEQAIANLEAVAVARPGGRVPAEPGR